MGEAGMHRLDLGLKSTTGSVLPLHAGSRLADPPAMKTHAICLGADPPEQEGGGSPKTRTSDNWITHDGSCGSGNSRKPQCLQFVLAGYLVPCASTTQNCVIWLPSGRQVGPPRG
jgi:hypothetical protein